MAVAALLLFDLDAGAGFFEGEEIAAELGSTDAELGFEVGEADAFLMALESAKKLDQANALGVALAAVFLLGFQGDAGFLEGDEVAADLGAADAVGFLEVREADADEVTLQLVEDANQPDGLGVARLFLATVRSY